ncbi:hypothetical protein NA56DRAFT_731135 [Hyaloscypha hepaticicola]|uniref:Uncharacterized protein n=1 Tax=Hyaloscypha hepaticicola TaxID=2082293 RepID=A0A2J6PQH0_9HELO|nr:hypothetical protein NA56DRAFT_731135 [Hyaloscypha hepaticicola]
MASSSSPTTGNISTINKPLTSAEKKGLQLPRSKTVIGKKQIVIPTRHGPLTINQGEESFILDTGSSTINIYFNIKDKCHNSPRELLPDIRHFIKETPYYNKLLKAYPNTPVRDWIDTEKKEFIIIINKLFPDYS